jgi:uncharacterized protein (TIGR03067 family)
VSLPKVAVKLVERTELAKPFNQRNNLTGYGGYQARLPGGQVMSLLSSFGATVLCLLVHGPLIQELKDLGTLQGTWVVVSAETFHFGDGHDPEGSKFTFEGARMKMSRNGNWYAVRVNCGRKPSEMDLIRIIDDAGSTQTELCIYELTKDRLRICFGGCRVWSCTYWSRPSDFTFSPPQNSVYVLKREKRRS